MGKGEKRSEEVKAGGERSERKSRRRQGPDHPGLYGWVRSWEFILRALGSQRRVLSVEGGGQEQQLQQHLGIM